jgi:hypothetical protein
MSAILPWVMAMARTSPRRGDGELLLLADAQGLVELAAGWRMSAICPG